MGSIDKDFTSGIYVLLERIDNKIDKQEKY